MIISSDSRTNDRTNPSAPTKLLCSVETEYRELLHLRGQVKKAEAAAARCLRDQKNLPSGPSPDLEVKDAKGK
jgi:hypothetical protein